MAKNTIWLRFLEAKISSTKGAVFAVADLLEGSSSDKPLCSFKTKASAKGWMEEVTWSDINHRCSGLTLRITVHASESVEDLGSATIPLQACIPYVGEAPRDIVQWYPLKGGNHFGEKHPAVHVAICIQTGENRGLRPDQPHGGASTAKSGTAAGGAASAHPLKPKPERMGRCWVNLAQARGLQALDRSGTLNTFATAELVFVATGKPVRDAPRKLATTVCERSLKPVWAEEAAWADIDEPRGALALTITVLRAGLGPAGEPLGSVTLPLSVGETRGQWFPLKSVKGAPRGEVQCDFVAGTPPPPKPYVPTLGDRARRRAERPPTLEERVAAARRGGFVRLDLARLRLGDDLPPDAAGPTFAASLRALNLKGNNLTALPPLQLPLLESLLLSGNALAALPALPPRLALLAIDHNCFAALPPAIFALGQTLRKLNAQVIPWGMWGGREG
jgi:hypothetical protein